MFYTYGIRARWSRSIHCMDSACLLASARCLENTRLGTLACAIRQIEGFKMMPSSAFILEKSPISCPDTSAGTEISKWISFTYSLVTFQTAAFVLGPGISECAEALSEQTFPSLPTLGSPAQQLHWCLNPCTLATYLSGVDPKGSCTWWKVQTHFP